MSGVELCKGDPLQPARAISLPGQLLGVPSTCSSSYPFRDLIIVDTSGRHKQEESLFEEMRQVAAGEQMGDG